MTGGAKVLVIDDEAAIRHLLRRALEREGHGVAEAGTAREALALVAADCPQLALLDLGLPDRDGLELVQPLKAAGLAVLVISARDAIADKVAALDLGADDYVTKPFDTLELHARIRTALRHHGGGAPAAGPLRCDGLVIDPETRRVTMHEAEIHLAPKEFAVLHELARHAGKVLTHAQLLRRVWGPAHEDDIEYLRVTIRAIRRKLGEEAETSMIRNEPAVGYRLVG